MQLGYGLLILALVATVGANILFILSRRPGGKALGVWAQRAVGLSAAGIVAASVYLMTLIGTHRFEFSYVAEYSSRTSATRYLIAAFWGGQEGSILLWAFWTALLGVVLARRSGDRAAWVWPIFGVIQAYLLGLLLLKCPFHVGTGPVPADGRGLNPLLQNPWMVIHPPLLFLGFASTAIPAVWTVHGLLHRDWDGWAKAALSWTLFSFATLGFGLALGGLWAYETLGWGGFWAWDPVENTSLVPWLMLTALIHGLLVQVRTGGFRVGNFILGILPFAGMNYGTFLTRTGVLSDFSVHSFSSLGHDGFLVMLAAILVFVLGPLVLLALRGRSIPKGQAYEQAVSREFGFVFSALLVGAMGLSVSLGMSAPLLTKLKLVQMLLGKLHVAVDPVKGARLEADFYNQIGYPLAIVMLLMMTITPYLAWKKGDLEAARNRLVLPYWGALALTLVMTGFAYFMGIRQPLMVVLFAVSAFTVIANGAMVWPRLRTAPARKTVGGFVAHMGAGMVLAGIALLVAFSEKYEGIPLVKDVPKQVGAFTLTYFGNTGHPFEKDNALRIRVQAGGKQWEANPRYYYAPWEGRDMLFANPPAIHRRPTGDVYIALGGEREEDLDDPNRAETPNNQFSLQVGQTKTFGDYTFTLHSVTFDDKAKEAMLRHDETAFNALPQVVLKALVTVRYKDREQVVEPQIRNVQKTGVFSEVAAIPGDTGKVILRFVPPPTDSQIKEAQELWAQAVAEAKTHGEPGTTAFQEALMPNAPLMQHVRQMEEMVSFKILRFETFNAPDTDENIYVELSTKPFIWLVWLGTALYTVGGLVAYRRRAREVMQDSASGDA